MAQIRPPVHRATPVTVDLLILRSGEIKKGSVKVCDADVCTLGTTSYTRQQIAWIELGADSSKPPAVGDPSADEIHLADGSIHKGHFVGLSLGEVDLDEAVFDREKVVWIHLAGAPGAVPGEEAPSAQPPPPTQPPPQPPQPPPLQPTEKTPTTQPVPQPRGASRESVKPCPADKPLGGLVILKFEANDPQCIGTRRLVMRFPLMPKKKPGTRWTEILWTGFYAPEITYTLSSGGCSKLLGNGEECRAPGGQKPGKLEGQSLFSLAEGSRRTTGSGWIIFEPSGPTLDFEAPTEIHDGFTTTMECVQYDFRGAPHTHASKWTVWAPGFAVVGATSSCENFRFCVPQAECGGSRPDLAKCTSHMERYAVLPFEGHSSWRAPSGADYSFLSTSIQWHVCCGCAALPTPPEFGPHEQPPTDCAQEIASLRGKKKGLEDAADIHRKDVAKKTNDEALAFRKMFGTDGGLFKTSNALLGVATKGEEGKLGQVLGLASAVVAQQQAEGASDTALSNFAVSVEVGEGSVSVALRNAYEQAIADYMNRYLATGDEAAAREAFEAEFEHATGGMEQAEGALKGVALVLALIDFYHSSGEFADQISEYVEAGDEVKEAEEQLDKTEEQINDLDVEIQTLQKNCPDAPPEESESADDARSAVQFASMVMNAAPNVAPADAAHSLKAKADQLKAMNDKSERRLARSILPYLVPFLTGQWRNTDRRVVLFLVRSAEPQLQALLAEVQQEEALAQQVITLAKTVQAAGQPPSHAELHGDPLSTGNWPPMK